LNARLNAPLVISTLQFLGHDLIFVSTKPAAAQRPRRRRSPAFKVRVAMVAIKSEKTLIELA
jgi:hypothetical protein